MHPTYSEKTSPAESPPVIKSPPPVLRERPKHTQPSPPNELVKLRQIVKKSPYIVQEGMHTLQAHTERNTNLSHNHQFICSVHAFPQCMHFLWHGGSLSPAKWLELILASMISLYGSRPKEIYVNFFGFLTSLEDVTDDIKS